jgi:uncharacterized Zn finger protein (UPF0148 family)
MGAHALLELTCPRCENHFVENGQLVARDGRAWCPECGHNFLCDDRMAVLQRQLGAALQARLRRDERMLELRSRWTEPVAALPSGNQPRRISEVLRTLDALLAKLDAERPRPQARSANG